MGTLTALPTFSIPKALAELKSVSRYIYRWIDLEIYKEDIGVDDISPHEVLKWAYHKAYVNDVEHIGITIAMDMDELCHDFHNAELITYLLHVLSAEYLKTICVTEDICNRISSIATNDEDDNILRLYLEYLYELHPHDEYVARLMRDIDIFDQTDNYLNGYLEETMDDLLFDLSMTDNAVSQDDTARMDSYAKYIGWRRDIARQAVEYMLDDRIIGSSRDDIERILKRYDLDKIQPHAILDYSRIDKERYIIPDEDRALADRLMEIHHGINAHHLEYWIGQVDEPTISDGSLLGLIAHHFIPPVPEDHPLYEDILKFYNLKVDMTPLAVFKDEMYQMIEEGATKKGIFTEYHVDFLKRYSDKLLPYLGE